VGTISGGRAPNVIADEARAEVMFRLVADADNLRADLERAVAGRAEAREVLMVPPVRLRGLEGFDTTVVPYTTDIPPLAGAWGEPLLIGPGNPRLAHTLEERISKSELLAAVEIYCRLARELHAKES